MFAARVLHVRIAAIDKGKGFGPYSGNDSISRACLRLNRLQNSKMSSHPA